MATRPPIPTVKYSGPVVLAVDIQDAVANNKVVGNLPAYTAPLLLAVVTLTSVDHLNGGPHFPVGKTLTLLDGGSASLSLVDIKQPNCNLTISLAGNVLRATLGPPGVLGCGWSAIFRFSFTVVVLHG